MIHVLGVGAIGKLLAHAIKTSGEEVTLLLRANAKNAQIANIGKYYINIDSRVQQYGWVKSQDFNIELVGQTSSALGTVIVCTKAYDVAEAVASIKSRLDARSLLLLLGNGIGAKDEIKALFKEDAPVIVEGILSHGAYIKDSTEDGSTVVLAGFGQLLLAAESTPNAKLTHLAGLLRRLNANSVPYESFRSEQLKKVLVNSIINPLTAITGLRNGEIDRFEKLIDALLREAYDVIEAKHAPSWTYNDASEAVYQVMRDTAQNRSSMLQDVEAGRRTEIDYITGYLLRLAAAQGVEMRRHQEIYDLIKSGKSLNEDCLTQFELNG